MEKELEKKVKQATKTYADLIKQRDAAKSEVLYNLLDDEINAYFGLSTSFNEYVSLLQNKMEESADRRSKLVSETIECANNISDPHLVTNLIEHTQKVYEQLVLFDNVDEVIYKQAMTNFLFAISRDYKDWVGISKDILMSIGETALDIATSLNPVTSILYFLAGKFKDINSLSKQCRGKDAKFDKIDRELLIIEVHTKVLKSTEKSFHYSIEILKGNKQEK